MCVWWLQPIGTLDVSSKKDASAVTYLLDSMSFLSNSRPFATEKRISCSFVGSS